MLSGRATDGLPEYLHRTARKRRNLFGRRGGRSCGCNRASLPDRKHTRECFSFHECRPWRETGLGPWGRAESRNHARLRGPEAKRDSLCALEIPESIPLSEQVEEWFAACDRLNPRA